MNKINKPKTNANQLNTAKKTSLSYDDFMTLFFVVAILLIDFLPYFKCFEIIAPQFLYLTVLNVIIGLYIYANPVLHCKALLTIFKQSYVFKLYLAFIAICGISIFTAKNVSLGVISIAEILVVLAMMLNFVILFFNRTHLVFRVAFLIGISAFLQAGIALYNFEIIARSNSVSEALNSNFLKGNTGNINILAASLIFKVPFIYIGISNYDKWKRNFLAVALIIATTIIFLINARTSLLSLIIITVCFVAYCIKSSTIKKEWLIRVLYILLPIIVSISCVNFIFKQSKLDGRYASTTERLKQINAEDGSINARLIFYKSAIIMAKKNPVMGIGLGNFRVESIPYNLTYGTTLPLHVHNDFLELTTETGYLNGIIYFSIFVALLIINIKRLFKTTDSEIKNIAMLTILLLVVYGMDAVFNFPFYRPTMQICFCFLMAFTLVNVSVGNNVSPINKKYFIGLVVLAAVPLYFTYYACQTSNLEYMIQTDNINFAMSGVLKGDDVVKRKPKFPNVFQTSESFVEYAGIYYFREKKYDEAIKLLDSANKINPYLGRPDFYKYLIANERGKTDSAYHYIKTAFYRRPINGDFYQRAIGLATGLKDTTEILKMYNAFSNGASKVNSWAKAFTALNAVGYSKYGLERFIKIGFENFKNDSFFRKTINDASITNLIIKGQAMFAVGKPDKALEAYTEGLKIDATNIYIMQNIGFYYYNLGKPSQAIPYFKQALKLPGLTDGKTEFYIAMCYLSISDKENACKYFKLAGGYPGAKAQLDLNCK